MLQDLRFASRQLRAAPAFTVVAVLTFALGIDANAAVFSVMNAVVLRLLPVSQADRLVFLHTTGRPPRSSQTGYDDSSLSLLWMILRESVVITLAGIAVGLPLAIAGSRLLKSMLFGLTPNDPFFFSAALVAITLVVIGASLIPARRASSVDPMVALRYE